MFTKFLITLFSLSTLSGCNSDMNSLNDIVALRELSLQEVKTKYSITEEHILQNIKYEQLTGLTAIYNPSAIPVRFLFSGEKIAIIYTSDASIVGKLTRDKIQEQYTFKEENRLRSRSGKRANLLVFPEQGFAVSEESGAIKYLEVFQPMTMEEYKRDVYVEVGPYIR